MAKLAIKKMNTSDDFLTPPELVAAMGEFDLDPCSSHRQEKPLARKFYRYPEDDGLLMPWEGSVFVNPPFSELQKWVNRFVLHANGVMLVPARVEVSWFWKLWTYCEGMFFTKGPVKYLCPGESAPPVFSGARSARSAARMSSGFTKFRSMEFCSLLGGGRMNERHGTRCGRSPSTSPNSYNSG